MATRAGSTGYRAKTCASARSMAATSGPKPPSNRSQVDPRDWVASRISPAASAGPGRHDLGSAGGGARQCGPATLVVHRLRIPRRPAAIRLGQVREPLRREALDPGLDPLDADAHPPGHLVDRPPLIERQQAL